MESRFERPGSAVVAWWQRRSRGVLLPAPGSSEAPGRRQPEEWPPSLPFRKRPKPYSRAIAWRPSDGRRPFVHDRSQPYELFVAQSVLRDLRTHLISSPNSEPYGFLLGHVVYCPWTRAPYVVIDALRRETHDAPHSGEMDSFRRSWASASREARRRRGQIIGWYHQHGVLGLRLSQSDLQLQEEFFPEAWHCALLIVPGKQDVVGGFIQRSGRASLYRKGISGFYELIDLDAKLINGKKPSVVDWTNYTAEERVEVIPAKWPALRRGPRLMPSAQESETDEPTSSSPASEPTADEGAAIRSHPLGGLTARRWKERSAPASERSGSTGRPRAVDPAGKKNRGSKSASAGRTEAPPDERTATTTTDLGDEFHEAVGPMEPEPDEAPARSGPVGTSLDTDDGQIAEFLEAIWGPPPFEPERNDAPVMELPLHRELMPTDASEVRATPEGAAAFNGAVVEPTALFGTERSETDSTADSLGWLLGLVEETIGGGHALAERADADDTSAGPIEGAAVEDLESAAPEEPPSEPASSRAEVDVAPDEEADGGAPPRGPRIEPAQPAFRPEGRPRPTFVGVSEDPDEDREAEIPVVMPPEEASRLLGWLRRRRNRALIAAAVAIAAASALLVLDRGEEQQPAFRTPARVAPPAVRSPEQGPEFIRLSGEFNAALAAYREREADFQLGRIDCRGLATGYEVLTSAFSELSEYVALAPSGSVDFGPFADDMREARTRFEASGCGAGEGQAGGSAS